MNQSLGTAAVPFRVKLFVLAFLAIGALTFSTTSYAQNDLLDGDEPAAEAPAEEPAADEPADNGNAEPVADNNAGGSDDDQTALGWVVESLGWGYLLIFLALSFTLVSLLVMNLLASRRENLVPQELVDGFEEKLNEKDFQSAYDMARTDESVLGQVLSAGLAKLSRGYNRALEGMQEVGEEESMKLDHRLSYMALIGNLSPMIGLFGTVHGMIKSFQVIAIAGSTPEPADLAKGISTALLTTLVGLAIAIPALAAYNILRNRVARLLLEVGVSSENLMSRFEDVQPQAAKK
ncbi:MotA/TolQ/ExbB proton channel family protein [Roseimaritima ulvae]|uniref:Biopolymer transport protein ExbB n=1 Tax=Roseimaritima ulvae TaxID=980254 RepID=A0A5B9QUU0_9BACT|nr:MotA/TolQ/ExbB proton channel family protein [Roseimaritima ulvae]QEG42794.1 Biopolymer transport protein ExbB [Roseimaritima ulvae]